MRTTTRTLRLALAGALLLGAILAGCLLWSADAPQAALERTRLKLRRAGFKLDLGEFDLTQSPEEAARAAALDKAGQAGYLLLAEAIDFLPPVGTNSALVMANEAEVRLEPDTNMWGSGMGGFPGFRLPELFTSGCADIWSALRRDLNYGALEQACAATLPAEGGIRIGGWACRMFDPLDARALLTLHEHDNSTAWTNLLAVTRLTARWLPEPGLLNLYYWRNLGRFRDEEALLRMFCACEEDCRQIQVSLSWRKIAAMPRLNQPAAGFTNLLASTNQTWRSRQLRELGAKYPFAFEPKLPSQWLWRMADCETMRRLLVAALALERYRLRHGSYPESTAALSPELLSSWPTDFMDGQPLRYRRDVDGRFLLYAIGLDGWDDGGLNRAPAKPWGPAPDDVWPRPASPAEVADEISLRRSLPRPHTATFVPLNGAGR
jgi:hypothetical protein